MFLVKKQKEIKSYKLENTVLVMGSGRSGTTWLAEALNANRDYRVAFEPFNRQKNPLVANMPRVRPTLNAGDIYSAKDTIAAMLRGEVRNEWVDMISSTNYKSDHQIIKEIRLNCALDWIQETFPELRIILIVRDPFSVAFSATEMGWMSDASNKGLPLDGAYRKKNLAPEQIVVAKKASTTFQRNLALWAMENYLLLSNARINENITSVYYEHLAMHTKSEVKRLLDFCGNRVDVSNKSLNKKSKLARKNSIVDPSSPKFGHQWQGMLTQADVQYAERALDAYGVKSLYKGRNVPAFPEPLDWKNER